MQPDPVAVPAALPIAQADPKPFWTSHTIVAAGAVIVSQLTALAGYHLDAPQALDIATNVVGLAGGIWAIWGRTRAAQPIAPLGGR